MRTHDEQTRPNIDIELLAENRAPVTSYSCARVWFAAVPYEQMILAVRPDRAMIRLEWIERAIQHPVREMMQADGRIRRWARVEEMGGRYLRVILLADGETVHNAFFDRSFEP